MAPPTAVAVALSLEGNQTSDSNGAAVHTVTLATDM